MKNIYVVRPTGFNIGNHVIFAGLRKLMNESIEEGLNFVSIPASGKYDALGKPGLTSGAIHEINQYGDAVVVGGGNLFENGEIDIDHEALLALRVPLLIIGVSWGRIYDRFGGLVHRTDALPSSTIERLIKKAEVVSVREASTYGYVSNFRDDIHIDGCPSINISTEQYSFGGTESRVLIPIRNPNLMNILPYHQNRVTNEIRELLELIRSYGSTPVLLCHDHRDISFASLFHDVEYRYEESVSSFFSLIASSRAVISYRLHASLPSLVLGKPTINISYDERAESLMSFHNGHSLNVNMLLGDTIGKIEAILRGFDDSWKLPQEITQSIQDSKALQSKMVTRFLKSI